MLDQIALGLTGLLLLIACQELARGVSHHCIKHGSHARSDRSGAHWSTLAHSLSGDCTWWVTPLRQTWVTCSIRSQWGSLVYRSAFSVSRSGGAHLSRPYRSDSCCCLVREWYSAQALFPLALRVEGSPYPPPGDAPSSGAFRMRFLVAAAPPRSPVKNPEIGMTELTRRAQREAVGRPSQRRNPNFWVFDRRAVGGG
jgi:hypothetical protein